MVKAGLRKLALQMDLSKLNLKAKKPWELFGLTKDAFHRLRQINGGKEEILWFQYMEQQHLTLPNVVICGMAKEGIEPANISGVPLSPTVIYNYLKRRLDARADGTCGNCLALGKITFPWRHI